MFKSNGGFTLVELIVVIAILAILAGIAVPTYGNYVTKAQSAKGSFNSAVATQESIVESLADAYLSNIPDAGGNGG